MVEIIIIIFGLFGGITYVLRKRSWLNPGTIFIVLLDNSCFYGKFKVIWFEETSNKAYLFVFSRNYCFLHRIFIGNKDENKN